MQHIEFALSAEKNKEYKSERERERERQRRDLHEMQLDFRRVVAVVVVCGWLR